MSIGLNSEVLKNESSNIKKEKEKLENIFNELSDKVTSLKDHWESDTSDEMYDGFNKFQKHCQELLVSFNNDIDMLDGAINSYEQFEQKANKEIENNIAE